MTTVEAAATYADAHLAYRAAGWTGPLPLPPGHKGPPPTGYTGYHGEDPSGADSWAWAEEEPLPGQRDYRGTRQLALRMPAGVIGIDVDHYGDKRGGDTMRAAVDKWGALPRTVHSTARGDGPSGIYYYRIPAGVALPGVLTFPDLDLGDVELIQRHHRYAVAWPSTNPHHNNAPYLWYSADGHVLDTPPPVDQLPDLPAAWLDALAQDLSPGAPAVDDQTVAEFARANTSGGNTNALQAIVAKFVADTGRTRMTRHDAMVNAACWAAREAAAGRYPAADAVRTLRDHYILAMTEGKDGARTLDATEARTEFARTWAWAVAQANGQTPEQVAERTARHHDTGGGTAGGRLLKRASPLAGTLDDTGVAAHVLPPTYTHLAPPDDGGDSTTVNVEEAVGYSREEAAARVLDGKVAEELERRKIRRLADEAERTPAEPIAAGALRWADIATVRPPRMRIRQLLAESSITWLSGRSGSYKSFLGVAIGMSVATGADVCGHPAWSVSATLRVLYVAAEGPAGVSIRAQAYAAHHGLNDADLEDRFILYPKRVDLRSESGRRAVRAFAAAENIGMIVYDTWHKVTPGLDDNSRQEIGEVMSFLDELRDDSAIESIVVDHTGHAGERATGSSSKIDDADCSLIIKMDGRERTADVQRTLVVDKLKDAETSGTWDLHLVPVPTVVDDEGRHARVLAVGTVTAETGDIHGDEAWRTAEVPADIVAYSGKGKENLHIVARLVMAHGSGDSGISRTEVLARYRAAVPGLSIDTSFARVQRAWDALYALDRLAPVNPNSTSKTTHHVWADKIV